MKLGILLFIILIFAIIIYFCLYLPYLTLYNPLYNSNHNLSNFFLQKCTSPYSIKYSDKSQDKNDIITRKTYKCLLNNKEKEKLLNSDNILIPSELNGTYCDIIYSTYYDFEDLTFLKNRVYNLNMPLSKCVRIRTYYFNPNTYLEVKYPGGTKIRVGIDKKLNILNINSIDDQYKDTIIQILQKIKNKDVLPIFNTIYKRSSFVFISNPSIRITIDTDIEFVTPTFYNKLPANIVEIKTPLSLQYSQANDIIKQINTQLNTNMKFVYFSKFNYLLELIKQNRKS
jgi:SPX domain protein involved in polyphosphate accumulation